MSVNNDNDDAKLIQQQIQKEYYEANKKDIFEKLKKREYFCEICQKTITGWQVGYKHNNSVAHLLNSMTTEEQDLYRLNKKLERELRKEQRQMELKDLTQKAKNWDSIKIKLLEDEKEDKINKCVFI